MKPMPIQRALERASAARWVAGKEERRKHIRALTTQVRDDREDYLQMEAVRLQNEAELQIMLLCAAAGFFFPFKPDQDIK